MNPHRTERTPGAPRKNASLRQFAEEKVGALIAGAVQGGEPSEPSKRSIELESDGDACHSPGDTLHSASGGSGIDDTRQTQLYDTGGWIQVLSNHEICLRVRMNDQVEEETLSVTGSLCLIL